MPKTIQLTRSNIVQIVINPTVGVENMTVLYSLTSEDGTVTQAGDMVFWKTLPAPPELPDGSPGTIPANWVQLPPAALSGLGALLTYVTGRITNLLNGG